MELMKVVKRCEEFYRDNINRFNGEALSIIDVNVEIE